MTSPSSSPVRGRGFRLVTRTLVTAATGAAFVGMASVSASAAPNDTALGTVDANVNVGSSITLTDLSDSFTLTGVPGAAVTGTGAVTGVVTTNSATGYTVGVQAAAATLTPATPGNPDDIDIADLEVANAAGTFTDMSNVTPVVTTTKNTRSDVAGDAFSDDYRMTIPYVNTDVYTVTLNYTATALA